MSSTRAPWVLSGLLLAVAAAGAVWFFLHRGQESTDDAQVEGRLINVAARVAGQVSKLLVQDNQLVEEGALLFELDDRDFQARLQAAQAELAAARAALSVARAQVPVTRKSARASLQRARGLLVQARSGVKTSLTQVEQARADLGSAEVRLRLAEIELQRATALQKRGALPLAELDVRRATRDQASEAVRLSQARLHGASAGTEGSTGAVGVARGQMAAAGAEREQLPLLLAQVNVATARVEQAEAAVRLCELNLSYTKVRAPARGVVSRRGIEIGSPVTPDRPLLSLVPPDDVWIVANFKEDQMVEIRPGQPVRVRLDSYGRRNFRAHVDSIAGATGARFSLLPPDNATGNFVKVTQRVPVLVRLDDHPKVPLRPGLSAEVIVLTRSEPADDE